MLRIGTWDWGPTNLNWDRLLLDGTSGFLRLSTGAAFTVCIVLIRTVVSTTVLYSMTEWYGTELSAGIRTVKVPVCTGTGEQKDSGRVTVSG